MAELIVGGGGLVRLRDVRGELEQACYSNRGRVKGKALEQARLVYRKRCSQCGSEFEGIAKAIYCGNPCRQKAKRSRAKVEENVDTVI